MYIQYIPDICLLCNVMYVNSLKEITVTQLLTYYIGIHAIC